MWRCGRSTVQLRSTTQLVPRIRTVSTTSSTRCREAWPPRSSATGALGPESCRAKSSSATSTSLPLTPVQECSTHARRRTPGLRALVAEAEAIPLRSQALDLLCFGQSWHWVEQVAGAGEDRLECFNRGVGGRGGGIILGPIPKSGSTPSARNWRSVAPGYSRGSRDVDWCSEALASSGLFLPPQRHVVAWRRHVPVEDWLTDLRSHSYVIDLGEPHATSLITDVESILRGSFQDGAMTVPYETRLWTAQRP